jgi:hypothetical protein
MLLFDKISVNQILVFSEVVSGASLLQKEFLEKQYQRGASNFAQTLDFLRELNLVDIAGDQIILKLSYEHFLKNLIESPKPKETTKKYVINCIVNSKSSLTEYLNEFLGQFHLINEQYEFTPNSTERLKYSGLRNFLIDLGLLYLDSSETKYALVKEYSDFCAELQASCHISPSKFLIIRQAKEDIGKAAELKIIEYEKEQLSQYPHVAKKIEHTAEYDVKAGYDIKSYEIAHGDNQYIPKYIEVKAVSIIDYEFFWSRNEMGKSEVYRQSYYLYLLPVKGENEFYLEHLKIIKDPYLTVFNNSREWAKTVESLSFAMIAEPKK